MKITFLLHFYSRIRKERERKISNEKEDRKKERKIFMSVITKSSLPSTLRYYEFLPSLHPTSPTTQDKPNSISPLCDVGEGEGIVASSGRSCKEREVCREEWNWVWGTGGAHGIREFMKDREGASDGDQDGYVIVNRTRRFT